MLQLYAYNAGKGDCIRIRFAETHNIIIDSGVIRFAPKFNQLCREIISSGQTLDALILTHVDDDHIGGFLANLRLNSYQCPFNEVWMNYDGAGSTRSATLDANLSTRQNNEVVARLKERNVPIRQMYVGDRTLLHGAQIDVVWPEKSSLTQGSSVMRSDTPLACHTDYRQSLTQLAEAPIKVHDTSCNNKNSIVFTFTYDSRRLLFTGDAWAEDIVRAKGRYDLIKVSHHGSVRNISEDFKIKLISENFLICTDGISHPDKQTIAKLEKWYGAINIYSPVAWWERGYFVADDKQHKINYYQKEGLVIAW